MFCWGTEIDTFTCCQITEPNGSQDKLGNNNNTGFHWESYLIAVFMTLQTYLRIYNKQQNPSWHLRLRNTRQECLHMRFEVGLYSTQTNLQPSSRWTPCLYSRNQTAEEFLGEPIYLRHRRAPPDTCEGNDGQWRYVEHVGGECKENKCQHSTSGEFSEASSISP